MKTEQLNRLLNTACEIISVLECNADANLQNEIDAFFSEVIYSDELDAEMERIQATYTPTADEDNRINDVVTEYATSGAPGESLYTIEDFLIAGEIGEINDHDYKHLASLLDEARRIRLNLNR